MRRPIDRPAVISGDRATHAAYNVGPATDYAIPGNANVIAPFNATASTWNSSTGGETLVLRRSDGAKVEIQHIKNLSLGSVREGQVIAQADDYGDWTGTAWTGPHIHVWVTLADGARLSFEELIQREGGQPAALWSIAQPTVSGLAGGGIDIERMVEMGVLSLHKNADKGDSNFICNEMTLRYLEVNDIDARAMAKAFNVPWGEPIYSPTVDSVDRLRASIWDTGFLPTFKTVGGGESVDTEAILAAIAKVPEDTLTAFGLKRI